MSYNPAISHYRRAHAPLRRYLSPDITITAMFEDFERRHPGICKRETYRKEIKRQNIGFTKLGEEECEVCVLHDNHKHDENDENCESCAKWREHLDRAKLARHAYQTDAEKVFDVNHPYLAADMQKVIMLPRLPGIKSCLFTRRLITINETFAPLGNKSTQIQKAVGVLWHEGLAGRDANDVTSAYMKLIGHFRDAAAFTIWADNCAAQNKNWTLITALCWLVNHRGGPKKVTLKFFEVGHTFNAADSFHHRIENEFRKEKNIYDFRDFVNIVNKRGTALVMEFQDFKAFENGLSQGQYTNRPLLADAVVIELREGSSHIFWKESFEDTSFKNGEFLKKKISEKILRGDFVYEGLTEPRGVQSSKKADLLKNWFR